MSESKSESTQTEPNSFLDRFRENATWNIVSQIALWIVGIGSTIFMPPPIGPTQQPQAIENVAHYLIAVLAGVIIVFALVFDKRRHLRNWLIPVPIALLLTMGGYFVYSQYIEDWTCLYTKGPSPRLVVVGATETPRAQASRQDPRCKDTTDCNAILYCHGSDEYRVWDKNEINRRRRILTGAYFSMLPFVLVAIMCVIQAIYCARQQEERDTKEYFGGIWKGEMERGKTELLLNLQFSPNSVTGTIVFYALNQDGAISVFNNESRPRAIEESEFKEDSLIFLVRRRHEKSIKYQMTLTTNVDEASLDTVGEPERLHWNLYREKIKEN